MLSKKKKKADLPLKDIKLDNKWFSYYREKFGNYSSTNSSRKPSSELRSPSSSKERVASSSPSEQRACSMKGSDSIVLPLAYKRVSYEEERRRSPVRILGGGGGGGREHKVDRHRTTSSKNSERDSSSESRRRSSVTKEVDLLFPAVKAYGIRDSGKEESGFRNSLTSGSHPTSSSSRDLRRKSDTSIFRSERSRRPDREDEKPSRGRRKSVAVDTEASSSTDNATYARASSQRHERLYESSTQSQQSRSASFRDSGFSNASRAAPSASDDSSSESSHESADIAESSQERRDKPRNAGEAHNDASSCSSSGSISPLSLNSRLTEMKLRSEQPKRPSVSEEKIAGKPERRTSQSGSLDRVAQMSSSLRDPRVPRDSTASRSRTGRDVPGLVGLHNEGNTCYLNSCLQCLAHSLPLASSIQRPLQELVQRRGSGTKAGSSDRDWSSLTELLAYSFRQLVRDLWQRPAFTATSARTFLQCLQVWAPQFAGHSQHDAQEVLRAILDGLHEALNKVTTPPPYRDLYLEPKPEEELADLTWKYHRSCQDSIIQDIFCGQLQSTIECCTCHRKSHCFDPFLDLSLPFPKHGGESFVRDQFRGVHSRARVTLQDCLSAFVAPEQLEGSNKYYCPSCKAPRTSMKKLTLYRLPPVLVLHIKRFYKTERFSYQKDDTAVYYPLKGLDVTDFLSARARRPGRQAVYDLYGVCCHMGSLGCGHYTAQCKNWENDIWYCFNDSTVSAMQDGAVLSSSAYILFYQQRT